MSVSITARVPRVLNEVLSNLIGASVVCRAPHSESEVTALSTELCVDVLDIVQEVLKKTKKGGQLKYKKRRNQWIPKGPWPTFPMGQLGLIMTLCLPPL